MLLELISIRNTCSKDLRYALKCRNRMATADYKEAKIRTCTFIFYQTSYIFYVVLKLEPRWHYLNIGMKYKSNKP